MIEGGTASGRVEDTGLVGLEDRLVGLNGDGERGDVHGGLHLAGVVLGDVSVGGDSDVGVVGLVSAAQGHGTVARGVGVVSLEHGIVAGLEVVVGVVLETTVTTHVAVLEESAINELLLGEGKKLSGGEEVSALEGTGGGESPA